MDELIEILSGGPWLNLVFFFLALAGVTVTIFFSLRGRKEKEPRFNSRTHVLIEDHVTKIEEVKILYLGEPVRNLTLTKFALWNKGRDPINRSDVAPQDPLRIEAQDDCKILGAEISFIAVGVNNFDLTRSENGKHVGLNFDYFANNEGLVVNIFHTGKNDGDLILKGTIKGVQRIAKATGQERYAMATVEKWFDFMTGFSSKYLRGSNAHLGFVVIALILAVLAIPALVLDQVIRMVRRPPREYLLESAP